MTWKLLDCANANPNCRAHNQTVDANPDIAGIGVIVGFLSTTCLAFCIAFTVIFLDRYERIVNFYRRRFTKNKEEYHHDVDASYWRSTAFWARVLSKNLLAFSDTQLLTGLAIQFTAMLKHCEISVYHFRIVTELAFLTTITHLLTVIALRNYFVKYRWINLPRIFFMLGNLALLGYTSFVAYSYDLAGLDISMSLACFYQGERPELKAAFGGKWAALIVGAIGGHATVILAMYWLKDPEEGDRRQWWWYFGAAFRTWFVAPVYSIYGLWMAGDGLQHTQALGTPNVEIRGDGENMWNFGQFLPVLLLALPLFAGWESFWEEKDQDRLGRFGRLSGVPRHNTANQIVGFEMQSPKGGSGPVQRHDTSSDVSVEERAIESLGPSPAHTLHHSSTSRVSVVQHFSYPSRSTPRLPQSQSSIAESPSLLSFPLPDASLGLDTNIDSQRGPRSSSHHRDWTALKNRHPKHSRSHQRRPSDFRKPRLIIEIIAQQTRLMRIRLHSTINDTFDPTQQRLLLTDRLRRKPLPDTICIAVAYTAIGENGRNHVHEIGPERRISFTVRDRAICVPWGFAEEDVQLAGYG
ncbi:hypothetical protein DDE82_001311 [Stemphylium lycopersici]|nr:hypothetical protein TW65_06823 [Stemphylium lycopersici]RAR10037.1 hypothetical protein DDE82_001311 [Stemphylium lycopersici]